MKINKIAGLGIGLLIASSLAFAPLAQAENDPVAPDNISTVDLAKHVTFTIKKYKGEPGDQTTPLKGIDFKIEKVNLPDKLDTNKGWEEVSKLKADTACASANSCEVVTEKLTTGEDGTVTISTDNNPKFTVGVYKVTELDKPGYTAAAPFLITLPISDKATNKWVYTLTAEPKNQELRVVKTVKDDRNAKVGDTFTYTVKVPVPYDTKGNFIVEDKIPAGLTPQQADIAVATAEPEGKLNVGGDYELAVNGQEVKITLTEQAKTSLGETRKTNSKLALVITIPVKVTAFPTAEQNHTYTNQAAVTYPNRAGKVLSSDSETFDPTAPDAKPSPTLTKYVDVEITKNGEDAKPADMAGAEFKIYECKAKEGEADKYQTTSEKALLATTTADGTELVDTFKINDEGKVTAYNLQDPRFRDGVTLDGDKEIKYCAVEHTAPKGYAADPEPRLIKFEAGQTLGKVAVYNFKETIWGNLPLTGAAGVYTLVTLGSILVVSGIALTVLRNRRKEEN